MNQKRLKSIVRWVIALLCIGYIVVFFWQQRAHLEVAFRLDLPLLLLVLVLLVIYYLLYSYRYLIVIEKCSGTQVPYWGWFRLCVLGLFLNKFVPQMGNIYRGVRLKKDYQVTYTRYISVYLSFAWMDTCLNMVIAMIVMAIAEPDLQISGINASFLFGALAIIIALIPIIVLQGFRLVESKTHRPFWIQAKLSEVFEVTVGNLHDLRYILNVLFFILLTFIEMCTVLYICFRSLGLPITFPAMVLFYAVYKISTYLNITPGNLGIRELAYGILSELMHIGMAEGIVASAIFRVLTYIALSILAVPLGGLDLLRHREQYHPHSSEE